MIHLRIEDSPLYRGAVTCSCGDADCTRWHDDARRVASFRSIPASARQAMATGSRRRWARARAGR